MKNLTNKGYRTIKHQIERAYSDMFDDVTVDTMLALALLKEAEQAAAELARLRAVEQAAVDAAKLLQAAYDDYTDHAPECVKNMDFEAECDCGYWDWKRAVEKIRKAAESGKD